MQKKFLILLTIVAGAFITGSPAKAQDESDKFTAGATNGRQWLSWDMPSKIIFLRGICEGAVLVALKLPDDKCKAAAQTFAENLLVRGFRTSEIAKQVDEFYSDSANLRIPVISSYKIMLSLR